MRVIGQSFRYFSSIGERKSSRGRLGEIPMTYNIELSFLPTVLHPFVAGTNSSKSVNCFRMIVCFFYLSCITEWCLDEGWVAIHVLSYISNYFSRCYLSLTKLLCWTGFKPVLASNRHGAVRRCALKRLQDKAFHLKLRVQINGK